MKKIGIRLEDKYAAERRAAITPEHAKRLIDNHQLEIHFMPCNKRIFKNEEYIAAGCKPVDSLSDTDVVFGVKEIPLSFFEERKTYVFFSHVIKGQPYNMPMLKKMMEMKCNLIDYERVVDDQNRRLIFFGRFAGLAGMINSLWSLGLRLKEKGIETPFLKINHACTYNSLEEAKQDVAAVGKEIAANGLPAEILPLTIGITGYGNVSKGTQEILDLLPTTELSPKELLTIEKDNFKNNVVYKTIFKEVDLYKKADNSPFDLQHFYHHPSEYVSDFEQYVPHISVLMNCMYWDNKADRILTKEYLRNNWKSPQFRLTVIGDITCDPNGSIECTHKGTDIEDPIFVYNPDTEEPKFGADGEGILVMAVDILPSELPRESSYVFANALEPFINDIVNSNFSLPFEELTLPLPMKRALILHNGELTPDFKYIEQYL